MSLTVKPLNGDATFLLTFAPTFAPSNSKRKFPGSYTILVDPWLDGDSIMYHRKFANTRLNTPPAFKTLADLGEEVDLIIVSQDKADHLSKETLCTLPKDTRIKILATAKAAKKILGWQHFQNPHIVQVMKPYQAERGDTIIRIPIEPYSSASADGEITITNIVEKGDITNLHNAIGITYCPPGTLLTSWDGTRVNLDSMPVLSNTKHRGRTQEQTPPLPPEPSESPPPPPPTPLTRIDSPLQQRPSTSGSRAPSNISHLTTRPPNHENVLSLLFSPHGLPTTSLHPYLSTHLSHLKNALPLTALFHSLTTEANPWWLGGVVCKGAPGGAEIVNLDGVGARHWISAHDEVKEVDGWATKWRKTRRYEVEDVASMLGEGKGTEVCVVGCGETRRFT